MAGGAVASAALKLGDLLMEEANFLGQVRSDVEWLRTQLRWMECFLKDADARRRKGDERMNNWVRDVREVAYQAEDAVDTFIYHIHGGRRTHKLHFLRRLPLKLLHIHALGNDIVQIKSRIQSIHDSRVAYGILNLNLADVREEPSASGIGRNEEDDGIDRQQLAWRQVSPHLGDDTVVVGFDAYTQFILETYLLDVSNPRRLVVSIVGMGGLGKTTLATTVYNSREVGAHFSICAWITVSQDYRVSGLLRNIISKVAGTIIGGGEQFNRMDEGELKLSLYKFLQHTRYFIVLDDIWGQEMWEQIKPAFPNANNGSRVLLTTRFLNIAKSADPTISPFELPFLTEQQSWELFLNKVFPYTTVPSRCPEELEELGRDLVKRCGGLPLALVVLGGMLSSKEPTFTSWLQVADNMDWESTRDGQQCLRILALSYAHLPNHYLKSCFLYLGCFPEDYQMKASELISLWIAEGFIPLNLNERQTPEEIAHGYIDELVQRCMVQVVERSATARWVKSLRIHDLVRDLCISEAKEDRFFQFCSSYIASADHEIASSRRLVMLDRVYQSDVFCHSGTIYSVRAVLGFNTRSLDMMILNSILQGFKLLRVIHLYFPPEVQFHKLMLPKEISSLIHLRHITLRTLRLWYLPSSIGKLRNLLTFNIKGTNILTLPKSIYKIESLRHVRTMGAFNVASASIGHLRSLHTLKIAKSGNWIQSGLPKLSNLCKLAIAQVSVMELPALSYSLTQLNRLTSLNLQASGSIPAASLFASLPSHQHLQKLTLDGSWTAIRQLPQNLFSLSLLLCNLDQDAIAAVERLPRLVFLNLHNCQLAEEEMVCSTGWFPQLQKLQVNHLNKLKHWRIECGAMPKLTYLKIKDCRELIMVPDGLEHVGSLQKLDMTGFHPCIMTRLNSTGEDRHKIQRIPSYHIVPEDE